MRNPDKELLDGIKAIRDARQPSQDQITLRDQFAMAAMNQLLENPYIALVWLMAAGCLLMCLTKLPMPCL